MTYDARAEAHAIIQAGRLAWGCGGGDHSQFCEKTTLVVQRAHDAGRASAFRDALAEIRAEFDVAMKLEGKGSDVGMAAYLMAAIERLAAAPPPAGTGKP